ncbi:MAG: TIM barrel protein [Sedimentisphaerales bacterium]|nr:TIM barrel protein [Sedimentisphaerales bacterium]
MDRRRFLATGLAAGAAAATLSSSSKAQNQSPPSKFRLKYAPHLGMFPTMAGGSLEDKIKALSGLGFRAIFDNGLADKSAQDQQTIAQGLQEQNMDLGPFIAYADFKVASFVTRDKEIRDMLKKKMFQAVETAKRTNAKWSLVVPGRYDQQMEWDYQTANVIDNLKFCTEIFEAAGLIMVLEPLNPWDHPGLFLTKIPQAYNICRAVNSPCCKIVDDLYHQQITEGNLIPNIDRAWDEIASFHLGDNPGRKEPTTGEINFRNIFKHLHEKNYQDVLCMEHGHSQSGKEGEQALLQAYRYCDDF